MSNHLRTDKECENCGRTVEEIYCPNCGQKNTETRQSFTHLMSHVIEDITHYDSGFWRTIKYLMLRPGRLTVEYLEGKRQRYVPPVKLYIFISFVTFFLLALLPSFGHDAEEKETSIKISNEGTPITTTDGIAFGNNEVYKTARDVDSVQNSRPRNNKMGYIEYYAKKKLVTALSKVPEDELGEQFLASAQRTLPKVLFIYMPVFAFWLWLFHGKKRWYFFDHGIFTLHYFSFLLLLSTINLIIFTLLSYIVNASEAYDVIYLTITLLSSFYAIIYFFMAHKKMYGERKIISLLKSLMLFFINLFCIIITLLVTLFFIFINIH